MPLEPECVLEKRRVVITGLGAITPLGNSYPAFWEGLVTGRSGVGPTMAFDSSKLSTRISADQLSDRLGPNGEDPRMRPLPWKAMDKPIRPAQSFSPRMRMAALCSSLCATAHALSGLRKAAETASRAEDLDSPGMES